MEGRSRGFLQYSNGNFGGVEVIRFLVCLLYQVLSMDQSHLRHRILSPLWYNEEEASLLPEYFLVDLETARNKAARQPCGFRNYL